jgi:thiol:disulfide interchange protein
MRKLIVPLLMCLAVLLPAAVSHGQEPPSFGPGRFGQTTSRLSAEVKVLRGMPKPGETLTLAIVLKVQSGWKIQAGVGSGDEVDGAIPTEITIDPPEGWTVGELKWPKAKEFDISGLKATGYSGEAVVEVPITVPADAKAGEHALTIKVGYQACDATSCEMPTDLTLRTTINVSESGEAAQPVTTEATDVPTATTGTPQPATTEVNRRTFFGIAIPAAEGALGVILLVILSMIGGFLLNLTPCVLPVIPIKIMTISSHAGTPGRSFALGLAMAAGVVAFWVGIGIPAALFTAAADPSRLFGIWYVTLGIGVLIGLMGIGIMGLFTIQLPQAVYSINPKAETASGSFLFGVMTGVLGLPCFGFVAGALLAGSAALPPSTIIAIFTSLGIGMAAPYLVLSAKPGLVEKIPRTGPASELVKQIMGLLLLAAAAYFVGSGLIALVNELPYLAKQLHWWTVALFATLAGVWLIMRTFQITRAADKRFAFSIVGLVIAGVAVGFAIDSTAKARSNWLALEAARARFGENASFVPGAWNEYTPTAFEAARKDGYVVVLDFTAEWCINCKALKAAVLNRDPVRSELAKDDVVNFTVDLTSTTAPGWNYLKDLGQTGIPLLVIYTPEKSEPWQSNAYTPPQVIAALERARNTAVARR